MHFSWSKPGIFKAWTEKFAEGVILAKSKIINFYIPIVKITKELGIM